MGVVNKKTLTKTRRKTRDVDQVHADLASSAHLARYTGTKAAEDLPGLGRFYCVACAKWFETAVALSGHQRGKPHKRRLKQVAEGPYTQREAEAAIGLRTDNGTAAGTTLAAMKATMTAATATTTTRSAAAAAVARTEVTADIDMS
ncbi:c2h2 finger domain containing protein [Niveomyces insectorum RCEF 264]|uniref:C2h2 finger domain containing protein n=1 Tax=Niveomyces insectorum RCEF 264 TaxID=1081102 RepID=A0A162IGZ0_9HYPO|nr:c2h2 finger domain containing protein [Niveomyces insectorum RCEF 264]